MLQEVNEHGPLPYLICCEVNSVIRSNDVWNIRTVDRHSVSQWMVILAEALQRRHIHVQSKCLAQ